MKRHAGIEKRGSFKNLTACGRILARRHAPLSQPVKEVTCLRCRKACWQAVERAKAQIIEAMGLI